MSAETEKLVKELGEKFSYPYFDNDGETHQGAEWSKIAQYIQKLVLAARINELTWSKDPTEGKEADSWTMLEKRIADLQSQLDALNREG